MIKVSIIGSCVTRDLFELDMDDLNHFRVNSYISRATVVSMMNSFDTKLINIDNIEFHNFNERKALEDVNKEYFTILENNSFDVLIIDFIDERHPTYKYNDNFLTYTKFSSIFLDPLIKEGKGALLQPFSTEMKKYLKSTIPVFIKKILSIANGKPVFLHVAKYSLTYIDSNGMLCVFDEYYKSKINNWNIFLSNIYNQISSEVIRLGGDNINCLAGGDHKWDLQPFHYDKSYYKDLASDLKLKFNKR